MDKKLLERLILVEDNLRDVEGDLIFISAKNSPTLTPIVCKLGTELDILRSIVDWLEQENNYNDENLPKHIKKRRQQN